MSFKLKYLGQEKTFDGKIKLLDLVPNKTEYICATVNNRVRELSYEVYFDAEIKFLTVKDQDAIRTYETSLRYLVAMALSRIAPIVKFRFSYHVSRSIFIDFPEGKKVDTAFVQRLENEMKDIVAKNHPLNRIIVSNEEAKKIYLERGMEDKLKTLEFRRKKRCIFTNATAI